jgi:translation initiation factor 5A
MDFKFIKINSMKVGNMMEVEGFPCKVISIEKSKPGKHGAAKARIVGVDVFTNRKYNFLGATDEEVRSPILVRSNAQVVADMGSTLQIMDLATYETFEVPKSEDSDLANLNNGDEVEYIKGDGDSFRILRKK